MFLVCFVSFRLVGEEDELTIKDAVDAVVEGFGFEGEVIVSFLTKTVSAVIFTVDKCILSVYFFLEKF